jgi:hypothetical protein
MVSLKIGIGLALVAVILLTGCTSQPSGNVPTSSQPMTPQIFSGTANNKVLFTVPVSGPRTFAMQYNGDGNFIVAIDDSNGNLKELVANTLGSYSATANEPMTAGTYYLDVTASGPWQVVMT